MCTGKAGKGILMLYPKLLAWAVSHCFFFTAKLLKSLEYSKSCFHYDFSEVMMKMFVE